MNSPIIVGKLTIQDIPDILHVEVRTFIVAEVTDTDGGKKTVLRSSSWIGKSVDIDLLQALWEEPGVTGTIAKGAGLLHIFPNIVRVRAHRSNIFPTAYAQTLHLLCEKAFPQKHIIVEIF